MKVFVYFNLHRKLWSVKALEGPNKGKVIDHSNVVILRDVTPRVSEAGRQRVLREKRKNVHAGMVGTLMDTNGKAERALDDGFRLGSAVRVSYNPYKGPTFVADTTSGDKSFLSADVACLSRSHADGKTAARVHAWGIETATYGSP